MTHFPGLLKDWRKRRRLSQLDLAMEADVSARHISFLETGRAHPSADMIQHLSEVLDVPLDTRNVMMRAVGFAPRYGASAFSDAQMGPIREAIDWTLDRHAPYPGLVLDRVWRAVKLNAPAARLFAPLGLTEGDSMLDLVTHPMMRTLVENWSEVAHHTAARLRAESAAAGGIPQLDAAIRALAPEAVDLPAPMGPTIPITYRFGDRRLSMFSTLAQFSTVADEALDDLKIELFFPSDTESATFLKALDADPGGV